MIELGLFLLVTYVTFSMFRKNNKFSFKNWFTVRRNKKLQKPELTKHTGYSFKRGIAALADMPDVTPQTWDFVEEVNEHIRNNRK